MVSIPTVSLNFCSAYSKSIYYLKKFVLTEKSSLLKGAAIILLPVLTNEFIKKILYSTEPNNEHGSSTIESSNEPYKIINGLIIYGITCFSGYAKDYITFDLCNLLSNTIRKCNLAIYQKHLINGTDLGSEFNQSRVGSLSYLLGQEVLDFVTPAINLTLVQPANLFISVYSGYKISNLITHDSKINYLLLTSGFSLLCLSSTYLVSPKIKSLSIGINNITAREKSLIAGISDINNINIEIDAAELEKIREKTFLNKKYLFFLQVIPVLFTSAFYYCILNLDKMLNFSKDDSEELQTTVVMFSQAILSFFTSLTSFSQMDAYLERLTKFEELSCTQSENLEETKSLLLGEEAKIEIN